MRHDSYRMFADDEETSDGSEASETADGEKGGCCGWASEDADYARDSLPKPMSANTYRLILEATGRYAAQGAAERDPREYAQEELLLRQDFAHNKAVWCGQFRRDLWHFLINMNPVLSICYSHPLHPISRRERLIVYAVQFLFVNMIALDVAHGSSCDLCNLTQCGVDGAWAHITAVPRWMGTRPMDEDVYSRIQCDIDTSHFRFSDKIIYERWLPGFCCLAHVDGLLWLSGAFNGGGTLWGIIMNCLFSLVSFQLMFCGCVQMKSRRTRRIGESIGHLIFFLISFMLVWKTQKLLRFAVDQGLLLDMIGIFFSTKISTFLGATLFNIATFVPLFYIQRPKEDPTARATWDPPEEGPDERHALVKMFNPRFNVLASEYQRFLDGTAKGN